MATPLSNESKTMLRLLEDGEWHLLEDIVVRIAATVPPGRAIRHYDWSEAHRVAKRGPRVKTELSESEKIASGQRALAVKTVNSGKKTLVLISETPNGRMIRRRHVPSLPAPGKPDPEGDSSESDTPAVAAAEAGIEAGVGSEVPASSPTDSHKAIGAVAEINSGGSPGPDDTPEGSGPKDPHVCETCGLWVVNVAQHGAFHAERDRPPAPEPVPAAVAFFSEAQVRAIVAEEVGVALEEFRKVMQGWLVHRFAAVEELLPDEPPRLREVAERPRRFRRW
jgi:hypothetical protein